MLNIKEIRPGRRVHIETYPNPSSQTTLFLIHGLGGRGEQWREQIDLLKAKYSLVVPDLLGHGQSDKPVVTTPNPYSFPEFAKDLEVIFQQFSSTQNIIVGHSYGGALAASLAAKHADNVTKLIMISPLPCMPIVSRPTVYYLPVFVLEWLRPMLEKAFIRLAFDPSANPNLVAEEAKASRMNPMYMIKSMIIGMKEIPLLDCQHVTMPTLTVLGEHDGVVPPAISKQFYQTLPQHQFEMIAHAKHMSMLERPEQVNDMIGKFLAG